MAKGEKPEYTKGTVTQVAKQDASGFPLEAIERDKDGNQWHVKEGVAPVLLRDDDEVRAVFAESENKK
jgi:hypothetical protein